MVLIECLHNFFIHEKVLLVVTDDSDETVSYEHGSHGSGKSPGI